MKVLYASRHDPTQIDIASSVDYFHYQALVDAGFEAKFIGPFAISELSKLISRIFARFGIRYLKFPFFQVVRASRILNQEVEKWQPDVVLTITQAPLVFYKKKVPAIFSLDTTFYGLQQLWPRYTKAILHLSIWQEKAAFQNCAKILTNSQWSKDILVSYYNLPSSKIGIFPMPSALPSKAIPKDINVFETKRITFPLRLLCVGRDYKRKGIDIAIETVNILNARGIPAKLTVCGTTGTPSEFVEFVGPYRKSKEDELMAYINLYQEAHFLLHPAYFEPAGIVPSEAAAFGTPTITNDAGGLATTVAHEISGIVLPRWSPASAYADTIENLIREPAKYYSLCESARKRFEKELSQDAFSAWLRDQILEVAEQAHKRRSK